MDSVSSLDPDGNMWHWMAVELRFWRLREGLSQSQMAKILNCTKATVSNLEHARDRFRINVDQAKALDECFKLGEHFQRMLRYAKAGHDPNWFKAHVLYEQRAKTIRTYESMVIPGLLQTEEYARAMLTGCRAPDVEGGVELRMSRQSVLAGATRPDLWVIISENALDWPVGGSPVMKGQLAKLLEVSHLPNVILRVLPRSVGANLGLEGTFKIITVEPEGDVVYLEACGGGRLAIDPREVRRHQVRYDQIGADALSRDLTRERIHKAMESYS